ncbi:MAG: NAD-dependent epimerase/dehydratase family protein [Bacteroidales bacterium]|nr:NAD-dependent epimerase/dehydratase family protein [Bacteroidales bacterium]
MNILITGIHGFVGSNLFSAYKDQHTIYGLDIITPEKEGVVVTFDWGQLDLIPSTDMIIHLAGKAHDTKKQTNEETYFEINTGLTQKIFDWFINSNATKFIFFSSVKATADSVVGEMLTEDVIPAPKSPYGESKLAAEEYILKNSPDNKQVFILRPCMIHGPGNKGNLNLLYKLVQKGIPWPLGEFDNQRSFCSIDNLIFVIQKLIEKNIESGIYQVADDHPLSTNELVTLIAESLNKKALIWNIYQSLIRQLAKSGDLLHLPLNTERLKKLTESYVVSNKKLKYALGIEKMPVSSIDGMRKTLISFKKKTNY